MTSIKTTIIPVILCGGAGRRLWPLSTAEKPKQFHAFGHTRSLFQQTLARCKAMALDAPLVVGHAEHRFIIAEQTRGYRNSRIILEPYARGTAAAAILAAEYLAAGDKNVLMLIMPADHQIADARALRKAVDKGIAAALHGAIVTFGVPAISPHTGYGYIKKGKAYTGSKGCFHSMAFIEKPSASRAKQLLKEGEYVWNSGIFLCTPESLLRTMQEMQPKTLALCHNAMQQAVQDADFIRPEAALYKACKADTLDYAVMERIKHSAVVLLETSWYDVGSWASVWDISKKDSDKNVVIGAVHHDMVEGCYLHTEGVELRVMGVHDLAVVATRHGVLVASREHAEAVKDLSEEVSDE